MTKNLLINNLSGLEKYLLLNPYYDEKWLTRGGDCKPHL